MIIYQVHDTHGKHMAHSEAEALANEANGWKTVSKEDFFSVPREASDNYTTAADEVDFRKEPNINKDNDGDEIPRAVLESLYEDKFGKKPHHRMKDETIKEKIDADNS